MPAKSSENKNADRLKVIFVILAAVTAVAIGLFMRSLRTDTGWREIEANPGNEATAASSFTFMYRMESEAGGADYNAVKNAYTAAAKKAYQIFDIYGEHEGVSGLYSLNTSAGTAVKLEPELYRALELMEEHGSRLHYLAPVYSEYDEIFLAADESTAAAHDPNRSEETAAYFRELTAFTNDPAHVNVELLGDNTARLSVSAEYAEFASENGIAAFVDLYWLKNAFIMDMLEEAIVSTGYTNGYIVSDDGLSDCLSRNEEPYAISIRDFDGETISIPARINYTGPMRFVGLHDYTSEKIYTDYYFEYSDHSFVTPYIDPETGFNKSSCRDLLVFGREKSCAELMLAAADMMLGYNTAGDTAANVENLVCSEGKTIVYYGGTEPEILDGRYRAEHRG